MGHASPSLVPTQGIEGRNQQPQTLMMSNNNLSSVPGPAAMFGTPQPLQHQHQLHQPLLQHQQQLHQQQPQTLALSNGYVCDTSQPRLLWAAQRALQNSSNSIMQPP